METKYSIEQIKELIVQNTGVSKSIIPENIFILIEDLAKKHGGQANRILEFSESESDGENLLINLKRKTYYNLSLGKATWTILGLLMDLYGTKGITSAILSGLNITSSIISKIEVSNGEICVLKYIKKNDSGLNKQELRSELTNKTCPYADFECCHRKKQKCTINSEEILYRIHDLTIKGLITPNGMKWKATL